MDKETFMQIVMLWMMALLTLIAMYGFIIRDIW